MTFHPACHSVRVRPSHLCVYQIPSLPTQSKVIRNRSHTNMFERADLDLFTHQKNPAASIDNLLDLLPEKLPEKLLV